MRFSLNMLDAYFKETWKNTIYNEKLNLRKDHTKNKKMLLYLSTVAISCENKNLEGKESADWLGVPRSISGGGLWRGESQVHYIFHSNDATDDTYRI